jgi:protein TonB
VSLEDRTIPALAVTVSLAIHVAVAVWFALRPPMFRTARPEAPIEVALVPAQPLPAPVDEGGGPNEQPRVTMPQPPERERPRPPRRAAGKPAPTAERRPLRALTPALPQARVVEPGAAAPSLPPADEDLTASVGAADLGIGQSGASGSGPAGSGGGTGGGIGSGVGEGTGAGRGVEVKPRELRRPSRAEMRALYPEQARREGLSAKVRLQLLVDAAGRVIDVRVVRPAGNGFDEAAAALARRFLFEPGRRDGRPTPMWITLTYSFQIEG